MKKISSYLSVLFFGLAAFTIPARAQYFDAGGNLFSTVNNDIARDVAIIDNSLAYKIYVGSYQNISTSGTYNGFVVARDANENLKWWIDIQGTGNDEVNGVDVRAKTVSGISYGDIYITGYFTGTMTMVLHYGFPIHDLTTTIHTHSAPSGNSNDCTYFVTKLDQDGAHIWTQVSGSATQTNTEIGNDVDVSLVGTEVQVYTTGFFRGSTNFYSGTTIAASLSSNASWNSTFTAKYVDNGSTATCSWVVPVNDNSDNQHDYGYGVVGDGSGNVYMVGSIGGNTTVGSSTMTVSGNDDALAVKYNSSGSPQWCLNFGGSGTVSTPSDQARGVSYRSGYIYVSGYFNGTSSNFGSWSTTTQAGFLAKIQDNSSSATIVKANSMVSSGSDVCFRNTLSPNGNQCYVVGNVTGNATIKNLTFTTVGTLDVSGCGAGLNADGFIASYDAATLNTQNDAQWIGGDDYSDVTTGVACLNNSKIYICGGYRSTFLFDITGAIMDMNANPSTLDAFWGRYISGFAPRLGSFDTSAPLAETTDHIEAYPNPVSDQLMLRGNFETDATVKILDLNGRTVLESQALLNSSSGVDVHALRAGVYVVQISSGEKTETLRFVKQ